MNYTQKELREIANIATRAVLNQIGEKGSQHWSPADHAAYDRNMDAADMAHDALNAFIRNGSVSNAMSTSTPSEGGYTVGTLAAADVMSAAKDASSIRRACSQMFTGTGGALGYPTSDGTTEIGEQVAQNVAASALDPSFGTASLQTYSTSSKMITLPQELIQDSSVDVVAFVAQRAGERIGRSQNAKFTTGTGTGEPTGIVTAAGIGKTGLAGQTLTIIFEDLVDLVEAVDGGHLSLEFMLSQATRKVIRKIKDANGRPVWIPEFEETGASLGGSLSGFGAWINNDMPVPAANAKSILFGNFQKYRIRDVSGITISRFDDSAFALKNQVGFIGRMRSGANLLDVSAVKAYAHSAT